MHACIHAYMHTCIHTFVPIGRVHESSPSVMGVMTDDNYMVHTLPASRADKQSGKQVRIPEVKEFRDKFSFPDSVSNFPTAEDLSEPHHDSCPKRKIMVMSQPHLESWKSQVVRLDQGKRQRLRK